MKNRVFTMVVFILALIFLLGEINEVRADIKFTDSFSVTGFLRYELGIHVGQKNPNNPDGYYHFNLSRTFLQTEWTYKPSNTFKFYTKIRFMGDQTDRMDDELHSYNAFPVDVPKYDWTMMKASEDEYRFEVWELYTDIKVENLWLRLGKQQIVWGEMIGSRFMDIINPLDISWNMFFEPEEYENVRIPNWSIRASYLIKQNVVPWLSDFTIEGFLNPGDILPSQTADYGAPFSLFPAFPPFIRLHEKNNRGRLEYGVRLGGKIGGFYGTLNYLHLYNDDPIMVTRGFVPDPIFGVPFFAPFDFTPYAMLMDARYPEIDVVGATCNYYVPYPLNLVITFEGTWTSNQPYNDALNPSRVRDQGTWNYALSFQRLTFLLPHPASAADITLQFSQTGREGDNDKILGSNESKIDQTQESITLLIRQMLWHDDIELSLQIVHDLDDATWIKPYVKLKRGNHWYFDLFGIILSGSETRPGRLGGLKYMNEVVGRITYQF